jgi:hypothetical protein
MIPAKSNAKKNSWLWEKIKEIRKESCTKYLFLLNPKTANGLITIGGNSSKGIRTPPSLGSILVKMGEKSQLPQLQKKYLS